MVIITDDDEHRGPPGPCLFCGEEVRTPYLFWITGRSEWTNGSPGGKHAADLFACSKCCSKHAHGIIRDIMTMKTQHDLAYLTGLADLTVSHKITPRKPRAVKSFGLDGERPRIVPKRAP